MKKYLLFVFVAVSALVGCSKGNDPEPSLPPIKFEIADITTDVQKIVVGQRVTFRASISEKSGNINYEWSLFDSENKQVGETISGPEDSVTVKAPSKGEYTLKLHISRGEAESHDFSKKIVAVDGDFQYGAWGDSRSLIQRTELDNGYTELNAMVGVPRVVPNNEGLTWITYQKGSTNYTYYFKEDKLVAGGYIYRQNYYSGTDVRPSYVNYMSGRSELESYFGASMDEERIWAIGDETQKEYWLTDGYTMSQAIGYGYLSLSSRLESTEGYGSVEVRRSGNYVIVTYIKSSVK